MLLAWKRNLPFPSSGSVVCATHATGITTATIVKNGAAQSAHNCRNCGVFFTVLSNLPAANKWRRIVRSAAGAASSMRKIS